MPCKFELLRMNDCESELEVYKNTIRVRWSIISRSEPIVKTKVLSLDVKKEETLDAKKEETRYPDIKKEEEDGRVLEGRCLDPITRSKLRWMWRNDVKFKIKFCYSDENQPPCGSTQTRMKSMSCLKVSH